MTGPIGSARQVEDALRTYSTPFNVLTTAAQNVQFSIDPQSGLTRRRYLWYSNGGLFDDALISQSPTGLELGTRSGNDDIVRIHSAISGQYISQSLAKPGLGLEIDDSNILEDEHNQVYLDHGRIYAGAFWWDEANDQVDTGIGFRWDETGWYFFVKSDGQHLGDSPVPQGEFDLDPFDGTGPSGQTYFPPTGYVYNFPYTWYNEGPFEAGILNKVTNDFEEAVRLSVDGPSTETPDFPVQLVVDDAGGTTPLSARLGGMQYATYGAGIDDVEFRETDIVRTTASSYIDQSYATTGSEIDPSAQPGRPLVSIRREPDARDLSVAVQQIDTRPVSDDIYVFQWDEWNPGTALTDASFGDPATPNNSGRESRLVTDTAATDYTPSQNSVLRSVRFFEGGQKNKTGTTVTQRVDARVVIGATRVVTAVNDGDSSAGVDPFLLKIEEFF